MLDLRTDLEVELEGAGADHPVSRACASSITRSTRAREATRISTPPPSTYGRRPDSSGWPDEPRVVQAYLSYTTARPDSIVASIRTIANARGAVLVHCAAGKDRTGVVVALALDAAGVDRRTIVGDYLATAQRIDAIMARLVGSPTYRSELEGHDPRTHGARPGRDGARFRSFSTTASAGLPLGFPPTASPEADLERLRRRLAPTLLS